MTHRLREVALGAGGSEWRFSRVIYRGAHTLLDELAETLAGARKDYVAEPRS